MNFLLLKALERPFHPKQIHWRVGAMNADKTSGIAFGYLDARDVAQRLDDVIGAENWQRRYPWAGDGKLCCEIGIRLSGEWVWKADGAGNSDIEADKGAFSDAFKRAGVSWGIGRYLYDLPNKWYPIANRRFENDTIASLCQSLGKWQEMYFERKDEAEDPKLFRRCLLNGNTAFALGMCETATEAKKAAYREYLLPEERHLMDVMIASAPF